MEAGGPPPPPTTQPPKLVSAGYKCEEVELVTNEAPMDISDKAVTKIVLLHHHKEYMKQTASLLNSFWKRSEALRFSTFETSCDNLPLHVILLLEEPDNPVLVIGHAHLMHVNCLEFPQERVAYIESVIVDSRARGKGYGKIVMKAVEDIAKEKGYSVIYLNTKDKQGFYGVLGYSECQSINLLGENAKNFSAEQFANFSAAFGSSDCGGRNLVWMKKSLEQ